MSGQRTSRMDWGNITAWLLTGGLLGYGAVSLLGFGIFVVPIGLVLVAWFVARHPEDAELVVLALLFGGSLAYTVLVAFAGSAIGSYGRRGGAIIALATGAGFVVDLLIRGRRSGGDSRRGEGA